MVLPLSGVTVLDVSTMLAAPLASSLLSEFGAEVIKVEEPGKGDGTRLFPPRVDDESMLFKVTNRNKKSIELDLRTAADVEVLMDLVKTADALVLNYRPATAARWGLDYDSVSKANPRIVMLHLSAFGLTGPYAERPGFGRVAEAFGGLTYISGTPGGAPAFPGYPVGDAMAGLYSAYLLTVALLHQSRTGEGQFIDLALYEPVLRVIEDLVISYDELGVPRERQGNDQPHSCPNNLYPTRDGHHVVIPASTHNMWSRLVDLLDDPTLAELDTGEKRIAQRARVDEAVARFTRRFDRDDVLAILNEREIACGAVNSAADICADPQVIHRNNIGEVFDRAAGRTFRMQNPIGKFSTFTPRLTSAPILGEHTSEVLSRLTRDVSNRAHSQPSDLISAPHPHDD